MVSLYVLVRLDIDDTDDTDGADVNEADAVAFVLDGLSLLSPVDGGTVGVEAVGLTRSEALAATADQRHPFVP